MSYKTIKCKNCGNNFVWSEEEQVLYKQRGVGDPEYCPICRGIIEARNKYSARNKYER
jgi:NAD-dependent SIR2 family protein deacetylase